MQPRDREVRTPSLRGEDFPRELRPARKVVFESINCYLEYYSDAEGASFSLPSLTHHWLIVQEDKGPEDFLIQSGGREHCLQRKLRGDALIYIPPFVHTEWDFGYVDGCLHVLLPDTLIFEALESHGLDATMAAGFVGVYGQAHHGICRVARRLMSEIHGLGSRRIEPLELADYMLEIASMFVGFQLAKSPHIARCHRDRSGAIPEERLRLLLQFIAENTCGNIRVEDLAKLSGMSIYHFSRCFKQSVGASPHQYLMRVRVLKSRDLLSRRGADLSLSGVAYECGFADQAHFTRVFKKITGATPAHYRKCMLS